MTYPHHWKFLLITVFHLQDVSELRNELQRKEALIQKHLTKLRSWQQVLEEINGQHKKTSEMPQGQLAYLEQASANIPAPMKPTL
uniref:Mediator of RNA polymerase II transcription subunit 28 n=1 Tax=Xenopus tropicalis TaxID=8364 RepID=A0A6I8QDI0_XENTR